MSKKVTQNVQINSLVSMTPNHEPHLWSPNLAPCFDHFKRHVCTCNIPDCTVSIHIATDIGAYIEHSRNAKAYFNHTPEGATARIMVRQAESVFNLSQLMFALYHGQSRASTFRDLNAPDHRIVTDQPQQPQDRKLIHAGFDKIKGEQVLFFIEYNLYSTLAGQHNTPASFKPISVNFNRNHA